MNKILMVGIHSGYAQLFREDDELRLFLLEEESLYLADRAMYDGLGAEQIILAPYQQSNEYLSVVQVWHQTIGFDAVVPAF